MDVIPAAAFAPGLVRPGGRSKELLQHGAYPRLQNGEFSDETWQLRRLAQYIEACRGLSLRVGSVTNGGKELNKYSLRRLGACLPSIKQGMQRLQSGQGTCFDPKH